MKRLLFVSVTILGLLFASPLFAANALFDKGELMVPFKNGGTIEIHNEAGPVTVNTWDREEVKIDYKKSIKFDKSAKAQNLLNDSKIETSTYGKNLKIKNHIPSSKEKYGNNQVLFNYTLWIPRDSNLQIKTDTGKIMVSNVDGFCKAKTKKGKVYIENVKGPVEVNSENGYMNIANIQKNVELKTEQADIIAKNIGGNFRVRNQDGDIKASFISGSVNSYSRAGNQHFSFVEGKPIVETKSGNILLQEIKSPATAKSESGSITVKSLDSKIADASTFKSQTGPVKVRNLHGNAVIETSSSDANMKLVNGNVKFHSDHGSLDIASLYGAVNAKSKTGKLDVRAKTKVLDKPIKLETASGNIYLSLPNSTPADVKLMTKKGDIKSDLPAKPERGIASYEAASKLNGGGPTVELQSQTGNVELNTF